MNNNIQWQKHAIKREQREHLMGHKSIVIWLTGLSGSGKSTIGNYVENLLYKEEIHSFLLDGDELRLGLSHDLGFKKEDRTESNRRTAEVANILMNAGIVTIVSKISPFQKERENTKRIISTEHFHEIYVKCSLEECEKRDPKGLYEKARSGEIKYFTGISQEYEPPQNPNLILDTNILTVEESSDQLFQYIKSQIL
ncbi:adenylyl-sulfate kinase [Alkalibacillus haloalkaliphilus]|uniref:adenylyl-sulfate kinase n=1 Tax=Alkalibacillus haloalkaliphilus TaxID=94136 RepID=UPI002935C3D3|nr:adenylyl-sulfate kinase [Alkalibacillus haloalkaliphilus]MDV2582913.1 adenylyl-sulfate kinase [Alkalibacillus haloalkaliphilus]